MERFVEIGGFSPGTYMIVGGPIKSSTTSAIYVDEPNYYKGPDLKAMGEFVEWGGLKDEKKRLTHERDQIQRKHPRDSRLTNMNRRLVEIDKMLRSANEI
jgi:hypothetical protein